MEDFNQTLTLDPEHSFCLTMIVACSMGTWGKPIKAIADFKFRCQPFALAVGRVGCFEDAQFSAK